MIFETTNDWLSWERPKRKRLTIEEIRSQRLDRINTAKLKNKLPKDRCDEIRSLLKKLKEVCNYNTAELSRASSIDQKKLRRFLTGEVKFITVSDVFKLEKAFPDWKTITENSFIAPKGRECPKCSTSKGNVEKTRLKVERTISGRINAKGPIASYIRNQRDRKCLSCNYRWTTYEIDSDIVNEFIFKQPTGKG